MTRRGMMDERPDSRGTPGTPPAPPAPSPSPAPSPKEPPAPSPPEQPLMLATMTPVSVNVDSYLYEDPQHHDQQQPQHQPVIFSTSGAVGLDHGGHGDPGDHHGVILDSAGAVSLVYGQQGPGNTVVVLSELVDDGLHPSLHIRNKRKDSVGSPGPGSAGEGGAGGGSGAGAGEEGWRSCLEHPLTAATSAMLNINPGPEDGGHGAGHGGHLSHGAHPGHGGHMAYSVYEYKQDKLGEIWPSTSTAGGGPGGPGGAGAGGTASSGGVLQLKATNGATNGAAGAGLSDAGLSDSELHGLFLQPQQHLLPCVKREPEDLSHRKQQSSPGPPGALAGARSKLVLSNGNGGGGGPAGDVVEVIKEEYKAMAYSTQMFGGAPQAQAHHGSGTPSPVPYSEHLQYSAPGQQPVYMSAVTNLRPPTSTGPGGTSGPSPGGFTVSDPYYRDYFSPGPAGPTGPSPDQGYAPLRQQIPTYMDSGESVGAAAAAASLVERYVRQTSAYHQTKGVIATTPGGLTVDLPSPDSGIGAEAITPRDQTAIQQSFDYTDLCGAQAGLDPLVRAPPQGQSPGPPGPPGTQAQPQGPARSRPWHDFGRQNDADKIQIPKVYSNFGFKYTLETPISTSQRREDDRVTYINKGQFYGITMEYIPDPDAPMLKNHTVKSIVMLMFREEKSPEDEIKAWQFWHGRQHSVKQRILDADTKNSMGLVGCIEEVAHNAIAVYWNPLESPAKINVAVQCLSTDFSSQKGVKGLPLHIQIDTYEDPRDGPVYHRGYCQIKVFCDKGAERKTRDEERRAAKRKMTATGRKKLDELYHPAAERSEFYTMADLHKPPVLFTPSEELTSMELQGFYGHDTDNSSVSNGEGGLKSGPGSGSSPFLLHSKPLAHQTLKFHNHFPPDVPGPGAPVVKKEHVLEAETLSTDGSLFTSPALKRPRLLGPPGPGGPVGVQLSQLGQLGPLGQLGHGAGAGHGPAHGPSHPHGAPLMALGPLTPPLSERVMLYVRQETEDVYTPLHVVPPSTQGLLNAIENKYKISASSISNLYRKNKKGITVKIDDEMVKHYCNEDLFILEVKRDSDEEELYEVTLIELPSH